MDRPVPGRRLALGAVVALVAVLVVVLAVRGADRSEPVAVTVMTRNLYLGADITRPLTAAEGRSGRPALLALGRANADLAAVLARTDGRVRARLLAAEVATARPDVLGVQEAALWRSGPLQLDRLGQLDAATVDLDLLGLLVQDLAARGAPYDVVAAQQESDVEAPAFRGDPTAGPADGRDLRLTVSDVLLVRRDAGLAVRGTASGQYRERLDLVLGGTPYAFVRGWVQADLERAGTRFRVLSTHLESQSPAVALAQAGELLAGPLAGTPDPTVVVGDLNADPAAGGGTAYAVLAEAGWADQGLVAPGPTAALSETVDDPTAAALDRRLDHVLARGRDDRPVEAVRGQRTGADPAVRDPATGLWPSDHAGLVVELRIG